MSSILGHGLAGMSVWALARRVPALRPLEHKGWLAAAAAAGCLPDIDSLLGLRHRGWGAISPRRVSGSRTERTSAVP